MKKLLLILALVFTMLLGSCSAQNRDTYNVTFQNRTFTVNTINKTITYEGQAYRYEVNGSTVTITYPNNSEYWWTRQKNGGHGGWSDNYDESKYIPGPDLIAVLTSEIPSNKGQKNYFLIIFAYCFRPLECGFTLYLMVLKLRLEIQERRAFSGRIDRLTNHWRDFSAGWRDSDFYLIIAVAPLRILLQAPLNRGDR